MLRYELLGPLRIVDGSHRTSISAQKIETLLATLLIRAGQVVSADDLIAEIWGSDPPRRAKAALHVYVSQLRKLLAKPESPVPVITRTPGYLITVEPDEVDLDDFRHRVGLGRERARSSHLEDAAAILQSALDLWRGPALLELRNGPIINGFARWLDEIHLECTEMLINVQLTLGRQRELIGQLHNLVAEHPLNESFYQQLMFALYRCGRRAEAIDVFQNARRTLNNELGLDPCRSLAKLHQAILTNEDDLVVPLTM